MKKQVLGAALFALMLALFVGAYAADTSAAELNAANTAYAILYEDGTLVFQNSNTPEPGRTVTETYEVDLNAVYTSESPAPWNDERESVRVVNFADKISPSATAYWFYCCENLECVDSIYNLDTANVTDMCFMFYDCLKLATLDLSHFETANVTDMDSMFSWCSKLTALDLSHFNTANVKIMSLMFDGCSDLTAIDLSHFDTSNVTDMYRMFRYCKGLVALDLSHFDTSNVTNMCRMFEGCSSLAVLDVSCFDTVNVEDMRWMFEECSNLTALDLCYFDTANVTHVNGMFGNCPKLKIIYVSEKFTTASVTDSSAIFFDCTSLVGGNGTTYDESHTDKEYARIDTASAPGYFTYKPFTTNVYAIADAVTGDGNGLLSVIFSNPDAATLAVMYFTENGRFVSADLQAVQANAGTAESSVPANAKTARVILLNNAFRPLCDPFPAGV